MVEYVFKGLHDAAKEDAVLLYSPGTDTFLEDLTRNADRVFYFDRAESYEGVMGPLHHILKIEDSCFLFRQ
jgi:hypothetical protein